MSNRGLIFLRKNLNGVVFIGTVAIFVTVYYRLAVLNESEHYIEYIPHSHYSITEYVEDGDRLSKYVFETDAYRDNEIYCYDGAPGLSSFTTVPIEKCGLLAKMTMSLRNIKTDINILPEKLRINEEQFNSDDMYEAALMAGRKLEGE